ncbi:MAG TPA: hypothetical protein VKB50_30605 [Vicinamibacterales bacterium]|nr:hypothetical protein [Vicinamibacterales bacterium]
MSVAGQCVIGQAQRLWLLERDPVDSASKRADVCPYTSAIMFLSDSTIRVAFVRSSCVEDVDAKCLHNPSLRCHIERDAHAFETLDAAIAFAETTKNAWLFQNWSEITADPCDR